jgi:hypothetical protein
MAKSPKKKSKKSKPSSGPGAHHHSVYVVYLRNPRGDGRPAYYVGMTGLAPQRLVPKLYAHLNPMDYTKALTMEAALAESLRRRGYVVYGGH